MSARALAKWVRQQLGRLQGTTAPELRRAVMLAVAELKKEERARLHFLARLVVASTGGEEAEGRAGGPPGSAGARGQQTTPRAQPSRGDGAPCAHAWIPGRVVDSEGVVVTEEVCRLCGSAR